MEEKFEMYLLKVMEETNQEWYEVFDNGDFGKVEKLILTNIFNGDEEAMDNDKDYCNWINSMCEDL